MLHRRLFSAGVAVIALGGYVSLGCHPLPPVSAVPAAHSSRARLTLASSVTGGPLTPPPTIAAPPTTTPPPPAPVVAPRPARASRSAVRPRPRVAAVAVGGDIWGALSRCEAGGRPNAVSRSGKFFGAFQFSLATWHAMGMGGNPIDYDYGTQLGAAQRLQARSGWGQWPVCSRKLGLR